MSQISERLAALPSEILENTDRLEILFQVEIAEVDGYAIAPSSSMIATSIFISKTISMGIEILADSHEYLNGLDDQDVDC